MSAVCLPPPQATRNSPHRDPLFHFTDEETKAGRERGLAQDHVARRRQQDLRVRGGRGGERDRESVKTKSEYICSESNLAPMETWSAGQGN